jgi:putative transposase
VPVATATTALKFRIEPNLAQRRYASGCAGAARFAFNWALARIAERDAQWRFERESGVPGKARAKPLTLVDLTKCWSEKRAGDAAWWEAYPSKVFLFAFRDAVRAHRNFLSKKARYPRFKSKRTTKPAFTLCDAVHLRAGTVQLTRMGEVKISSPDGRQAEVRRLIRRGRARITSARISYYNDHWWVAMAIERAESASVSSVSPDGPAVGVDLGLSTLATVCRSDLTLEIEEPGGRRFRSVSAKTRRLSKRVSRRSRGGRNHARALKSLRHHLATVSRRRSYDLHNLTKNLVRSYPVVCIEDLAVKAVSMSPRLGKATMDQGLGELRRQLLYKAPRTGSRVVIAGRFYPSSKTCARCGAVRAKLSLAERTYRCDTCGLVIDRDRNAAANLAAYGEAVVAIEVMFAVCGCGTSAGDRDRPGPSVTRPKGPKSHARREGSTGRLASPGGGTALGEAGSSQQQLACA